MLSTDINIKISKISQLLFGCKINQLHFYFLLPSSSIVLTNFTLCVQANQLFILSLYLYFILYKVFCIYTDIPV